MIEQQIRSRPNYTDGVYTRSKLFLSPLDEQSLRSAEEAASGHWAQKIPGVRASNRAFMTFLNLLRADSFDRLYAGAKTLNGGVVSAEQAQRLANYTNIASGRGDLGKAAGAAEGASFFLFSPRLLVSRFQYSFGQPIWHGDSVSRRLIAKEYAKTMMAAATLLALAAMAGAQIEWDRRSSDFLKIRFGNTRIDILGGLPQTLLLAWRLASGQKKTAKGDIVPLREKDGVGPKFGQDTARDVVSRFAWTKASPVAGGAMDILSGQNIIGEPVTPLTGALEQFKPLVIGDVMDAYNEYGVSPETAALITATLLGFGTQTYDTSSKH